MKIGYPCINWTIGCKGDRTFRLKSYSEKRLKDTVENNLTCLSKMLMYNIEKNILFFRITSDLVPFASHPVCKFNWQDEFKDKFTSIGNFIKKNDIRISMHPDQFIVLNSPDSKIVERSIDELEYHAQVLNLLNLDNTAKIQLHVGGVYKDKQKSLNRFATIFNKLSSNIRKRLVIENDDKSYYIKDCLKLHEIIDVPLLFDFYHHQILNNEEKLLDVLFDVNKTWNRNDGIPMVDYSSPKPNERRGAHAEYIDTEDFSLFLSKTYPFDFDIMLEIKDKEKSALIAVELLKKDKRFILEDEKNG